MCLDDDVEDNDGITPQIFIEQAPVSGGDEGTTYSNYYFDSAFISENNSSNTDIYKLYELIKEML